MITTTRARSKQARRSRGQTLILACVTFLLLALMMALSFSVANAIHERIRIQAAADAQAFSIATLEARSFNTIAYMNRSIAAGMVAEMTLHAWDTIAQRDISMLEAGATSFTMIALQEAAKCSKKQPQHCVHAIEAKAISANYSSEASNYSSKRSSKMQKFKDAVEGLNEMMKNIHLDQEKVLKATKDEIGPGSESLAAILKQTAPQASYVDLGDYVSSDFACALEHSNLDGECKGRSWKSQASMGSDPNHVMESAAMAIRPKFIAGEVWARNLSHSDFSNGPGNLQNPVISMPKKMKDIQSEGSFTETTPSALEAEVADDNVSADIQTAQISVSWKHGSWSLSTSYGSASSGNPYVGVPCGGDNCFINFRLNTTAEEADHSQPATYGAVTQDLRKTRDEKKHGSWVSARPWEINADGKISVEMVDGKPAEITLVPQGNGFALAKGKTYFHQLGTNGWQVAPNLFDPFWRAKLHPFVRDELKALTQQIGDSEGTNVASNSQTAVEGVIK